MVSGIPNISVPTLGYTSAHSGKMSLPVDTSALIYSYFEHVSGVPAPKGTQGVTISKLNLLDVLIGQLNQIKKGGPALSLNQALSAEHGDSQSLDALIESYRSQIMQVKAAAEAMPYTPTPSAPSGAIFSLLI